METSLKVSPRAALFLFYNNKSYTECCPFPKNLSNIKMDKFMPYFHIFTKVNSRKLCDTFILSIKAVYVMSCLP